MYVIRIQIRLEIKPMSLFYNNFSVQRNREKISVLWVGPSWRQDFSILPLKSALTTTHSVIGL
jgi:hypothetical protein